MWKDIIEFIKETSNKSNNEELMSYYNEYVISYNPFKWVKFSEPNKIFDDIIRIDKIISISPDSPIAYNEICKQKFKSQYIKDKLQNCVKNNAGMNGIDTILKDSKKYIQMTFILRSIERLHNYERLKSIVATLLAILALVASIKITIIKIGQ